MTSTIGVKKIQHTNGTQVMTFDTAGKISSNITTTATINTPSINGTFIGRKNIIINGAMQVAQRSTSEAGKGDANGFFTLDRFNMAHGAASAGRYTMSQSSVTDLEGFSNALKIDCTTSDTSIAAGEALLVAQNIEGFNAQQLKATSTSTRAFTLSFYAKSNASRAIVSEVNLTNGTNRQISKLQTIGTTWARYTMTVPAASSTQIDNDNSNEMQVNFWLHAGSTYTGGTLNDDALDSITNANRAAGIGSIFASTDNTIEITGIQLELGETATAFEHRSLAEELTLCQRYFKKIEVGNNVRMSAAAYADTTTRARFVIYHNPPMRSAPTAAEVNVDLDGQDLSAIATVGSNDLSDVIITRSSGSHSTGAVLQVHTGSNTATLDFDAEL